MCSTAQTLDHALTSQHLTASVRGVEYSRGNADAPAAFRNDQTTSLRSADHDGIVLFVTSDTDTDGVPDNLDVCAGTRIPEGVPTVKLKVNRFALVNGDGLFDTAAGKNTPAIFSVRDTGGCSCEQILDRTPGSTSGERSFGCSKETMTSWIASLAATPARGSSSIGPTR